MLNNTSYKIGGNTTQVSFNSPAMGIVQKSHPKSQFVNFHKTSRLATMLLPFDDGQAHIEDTKEKYSSKKIPVTVLQIMLYGDTLIAEIVKNEYLVEEVKEPKPPFLPTDVIRHENKY